MAGFIGVSNLITLRVDRREGGQLVMDLGDGQRILAAGAGQRRRAGDDHRAARVDQARRADADGRDSRASAARSTDVVYLGSVTQLIVLLPTGERLTVHRLNDEVGGDEPTPGEQVDAALGGRAQLRDRRRGAPPGEDAARPGRRRRTRRDRRWPRRTSADQIVELSKRYTLYDWQAQSKAAPIAVERAEGIYFWDVDGKRYLDFNSQLWSVNIGHGDRRVIVEAIAAPGRAARRTSRRSWRSRSGRSWGRSSPSCCPGDIEKTFFTLGGAEANENAIKIARLVHGPAQDPGAVPLATTARRRGTMHAHRRPSPLAERAGARRRRARARSVPRAGHGRGRRGDARSRYLEETIELEGPETIAAFFLETVTGTNGVLIPPDGYLQGVRELCDRYGILMVADEVMCGFGRTGEWFARDHWDVVPDLICRWRRA